MAPKSHHSKGLPDDFWAPRFPARSPTFGLSFLLGALPHVKVLWEDNYRLYVTYWGWSPTAQYSEVGMGLSHAPF